MKLILSVVVICAIIDFNYGVSTKMDFGDEDTSTATNSSYIEDDDVEVKHTIVVSTKLKNNNRRALHSDGDSGTLTYSIGRKERNKDDVPDVPVVNGFKAVETTHIRTPDTRSKTNIYPNSVFINRNIRDEYDIYPNLAINPTQWKPSSFYNNINWWSPENFNSRNDRPINQNPGKFHRRITDDGMKEFYCRKCMELSRGNGYKDCIQQRSTPWHYEATTPKMKIDGKLAKLN